MTGTALMPRISGARCERQKKPDPDCVRAGVFDTGLRFFQA